MKELMYLTIDSIYQYPLHCPHKLCFKLTKGQILCYRLWGYAAEKSIWFKLDGLKALIGNPVTGVEELYSAPCSARGIKIGTGAGIALIYYQNSTNKNSGVEAIGWWQLEQTLQPITQDIKDE